jgi:glucose/arabinose dehydrogenase
MKLRIRRIAPMVLAIPLLLSSAYCPSANSTPRLDKITLPQGFHIAVYAEKIPHARSMTLSPNGTLFVGTRGSDKVYALRDDNNDQKADRVITVASGLDTPNGVAFRNGALYVAETTRILRYDDIESRLDNPPQPVVVYQGFPTGGHDWKFIAFGPDDKLYVPVGAPCNVCNPDNPIYSSITRMNPDGSGFEVFASGIRNTVGFDWHPQTHELWFTDNGRDWLGDNQPPDELDRAPQAGLHFGFPFCHGGTIQDPEFTGRDCDEFVKPEINLGPHVAALGMRFYTGTQFPEAYRGRIFIAEHGSWNRSTPIGYRITTVRLQDGHAVEYTPFAEGWLQGRNAWGRPVDVQMLPDGSLLVSDDSAGAIYRISYGG